MREPILVLNTGPSSIKFSVFESDAEGPALRAAAHRQVKGIGESARLDVIDASGGTLANRPVARRDHQGAIAAIHEWFAAHIGSGAGFTGIGHRVAPGGLAYTEPVLIDDRVIADLDALIPLAPLHHIAVIRAVKSVAPNVPQVACFDTAFPGTQPPLAQKFALPRKLTAKGLRRYGFHGFSYEYIVSALSAVVPESADGGLVIAPRSRQIAAAIMRRSCAADRHFRATHIVDRHP